MYTIYTSSCLFVFSSSALCHKKTERQNAQDNEEWAISILNGVFLGGWNDSECNIDKGIVFKGALYDKNGDVRVGCWINVLNWVRLLSNSGLVSGWIILKVKINFANKMLTWWKIDFAIKINSWIKTIA